MLGGRVFRGYGPASVAFHAPAAWLNHSNPLRVVTDYACLFARKQVHLFGPELRVTPSQKGAEGLGGGECNEPPRRSEDDDPASTRPRAVCLAFASIQKGGQGAGICPKNLLNQNEPDGGALVPEGCHSRL